jgi:hypothetical protein
VRVAPSLARLKWLEAGLVSAWLAVACILGAPVLGAVQMFDMASADADAPICHAFQSDGPAGHPGDHAMADCAMCLCCAPILAVLSDPPLPPLPSVVAFARPAPTPPARAPPQDAQTHAYPRGPPALI